MADRRERPGAAASIAPTTAARRGSELAGGLPTGKLGRIGLDIYQKNPQILYALSRIRIRARLQRLAALRRAQGRGAAPAEQAQRRLRRSRSGIIGNELYRTRRRRQDVAEDVTARSNVAGGKAPYSFNQIAHRSRTTTRPSSSPATPCTSRATAARRGTTRLLPRRVRRLPRIWWDAAGSEQRIMLGSDGGVNVSYDGGRTGDYFPNMRVGEAYAIGVDMDDPYNVYAGFQDHDSWKGPSNGPTGRITLEHWVTVGPGDGMYNVVDPTDSRWVYNTRELNQMGRMDQQTGVRTTIAPTRPAGQAAAALQLDRADRALAAQPADVYAGAQVLFRSLNRGDTWEEISPDLTTNDRDEDRPERARTARSRRSRSRRSAPASSGSAPTTARCSSRRITAARGRTSRRRSSPPARRSIAGSAASSRRRTTPPRRSSRRADSATTTSRRTSTGRPTSARRGRRSPATCPKRRSTSSSRIARIANLLVVGNDIGVWFSIDGGAHWTRLKANLPTVAVHDLTIHPRENDLVLAHLRPRAVDRRHHAAAGAVGRGARARPRTCSTSSRARATASARRA